MDPSQTSGPSPLQNPHTASSYHHLNPALLSHTHVAAAASPYTRPHIQTESRRKACLAMTPLSHPPDSATTSFTEDCLAYIRTRTQNNSYCNISSATETPPLPSHSHTDLTESDVELLAATDSLTQTHSHIELPEHDRDTPMTSAAHILLEHNTSQSSESPIWSEHH